MAPVLGAEGPAVRRATVHLGMAMQMTNIGRDVLEDARNGQTARLLDIHSLGTIFLRLSRFWGATVVLCFVAWFLFPAEPVRGRLLTIVFVGLASLTMPHMFLDAYAEA